MRRVVVIALCALSFLITLPAPAQAWWDWLDEYSGPGPFTGFDVHWRMACITDPAVRVTAVQNVQRNFRKLAADVTEEEVDAEEKIIRASTTPGEVSRVPSALPAHLLRALDTFKGKKQFWAALGGAGCLRQKGTIPVASLNFRLAYLWSIHNRLTYAEPEFAEGKGPRVRLLQPELSFTAFVDRRHSVELGGAIGESFAFVGKKDVPVFGRFYWRPLVVMVSPATLLRLDKDGNVKGGFQRAWRALTLTSSIVIMPQQLNDVDFGAVPGTFDNNGRDVQGHFGITLDLSRF